MSKVRERIDLLLDANSFIPLADFLFEFASNDSIPPQERLLTGQGKIMGREVYVFTYNAQPQQKINPAQDAKKIMRLIDLALKTGTPLIGIYDSQDQDKQEEIKSLTTIGEIFSRQVMASGVIPQIAIMMGSCSEELACSVALNDFVIMVENHSQIFLSSPERIKAVTHEEIDAETLGGSKVHQTESGVSLLKAPDENAALLMARDLFSFLPANNREEAPLQKTKEDTLLIDESLDTFIPKSLHQPYDMKSLIQKTLDESFFFEIGPSFAPNLLTGFGRYQGRSIGIVANQPQVMSGCLDLKACQKAARFIRFCDAFHLPLVSFVDTPGFLPGLEQEQGGILLQAAKLMHAYAEATSPKITLITRKSFSSAYPIMASKGLRSDLCLTYPASEIGQKEFSATAALELGEIDAIILPRETRKKMVQSLEMLKNKVERLLPKKHGNIPL